MNNKSIRYPKIGGIERVREDLKEIIEKESPEALIRIIKENNKIISEEDADDTHQESDRVAISRDVEI